MEPIAVIFIIFGTIGAILWQFLDGRHKERMAMIDKGVKADELKGSMPRFRISPLANLKWGLFFSFIGLGLIAASYLEGSYDLSDASYPAMILVFGGAALILFYSISKAKIKEED